MPKDTYYNLPDEKRLRVFNAAVDELIRVPVSEMSINQIIQNAGISRGSFYQYFEDKYDLAQYVLADYVVQFTDAVRASMKASGGDLFDGLAGLFRNMIELAEDETVRKALMNLIMEAGGKRCTFDYAMAVQQETLDILLEESDRELLAVESEDEIYRLARVLFAVLKEAATECLYDFDGAEGVYQEFAATLDLLRGRMERRS